VIDRSRHRILSSAKALTTKGDLAIGVGEAMAQAVAALAGEVKATAISLVAISTTLATNAVVEGHGSPVAALFIGFDDQMVVRTGISAAFPGLPVLRIAGGHDHNGDAVATLDENVLAEMLLPLQGQVSAVAIAGSFAVRNATHEKQARAIVERVLGVPVTLSSELSSELDAPRRALTAVLNARLIEHISRLIAAAERAMARLGISAQLMIMKGDGSLASAESVAMRPIETILSGPAASLIGAKWLSGLDDFLMSDMGGTTTDVGLLVRGRPLIAPQGAEIGGWRTMVKAIDVRTIGLGGDSEIAIGLDGAITILPQRAVPLALITDRYPELHAMLEADMAESEGGSLLGRFVTLPFGKDDRPAAHGLSAREAQILAQIGERPVALRKLAVSSAAQRALSSLRRKGLVQLCAFTPSDAAHVLGMQDNWNHAAALLGAKLLTRLRMVKAGDEAAAEALSRDVWDATVTKSARVLLDTALGTVTDGNKLVDSVCRGLGAVGRAKVSISPQMPIVAVGGPVRIYYGEVAQRLSCEVVFTPYCDVANAVGAASAVVADRVTLTVEGDGNGMFRVHGTGQSSQFSSGVLALRHAEEEARKTALRQALDRGAREPKLSVDIRKSHLPEAVDDEGLLTAEVVAEAIGTAV
jgi:N-methylhydantoinase A/oxoprolinase/acetone carboxylase beta subunit